MVRIAKLILFIFIPAVLFLSGCSGNAPENVTLISVSWVSDDEPLQCGKDGTITAKFSVEVRPPGEQTVVFRVSMWDEELELGEAKKKPVVKAKPDSRGQASFSVPINVYCSSAPDCWFEGDVVSTMKRVANPYIKVTWANGKAVEPVIDGWEKKPKPFKCVVAAGGNTTPAGGVDKPEPVGVIVVGSLFEDLNANGVKDVVEHAAANVSVRVKELACGDDCEPVATSITGVEGDFSMEYVPQEGASYTIDVLWRGWPAIYQSLNGDVYFPNLLEDVSPDTPLVISPMGLIQMERIFFDAPDDVVKVGTHDPMDNPSGDLEWVTVGVNPDGSIQIELGLPDDEAKNAHSMAQFIDEMWGGTERTITYHKYLEDVDKGVMEGGSGGRPNIVPSDVNAEFSSFTVPLETVPLTEAELEDYFIEYGIRMFHQNSEADEMSYDEMFISQEELGYVLWWLQYYWFSSH